jgi:hypothetical protein
VPLRRRINECIKERKGTFGSLGHVLYWDIAKRE